MGPFDPDDFEILYPGVHVGKEKEPAKRYFAENRALQERGPVDIQALVAGALPEGTPGVGPMLPVTETMVRYNNEKYDPENPLLNDADYARSCGYPDILAMPCYGAHDDTFLVPYPPEARDTLLVSQLNHSVTNHRPVHPGDTLFLVCGARYAVDRTPPQGSIYRHIALRCTGSVYNQRGEKINDVTFRVTESLKLYKEDKRPEKMGFAEIWDAPDWMARPAHYYTDEDWNFIKGVWANEKRRGPEPLYWEEVNVGDEPTWTADGPIEESLAPTAPYGLGSGGSRTMKKEIMDPGLFKTMVRGEKDGIYRLPDREAYVPSVPDGVKPFFLTDAEAEGAVDTRDIHKAGAERAVLINFLGRDLAVRHINNWMGDQGWLYNIRWGMMPAEAHAALGRNVPADPEAEYFLGKIPAMNDKHVMAHGLTGDLALVKSYVYDKYVRDGMFLVDLGWWIETIEGDIWLAGGATVKLPSGKATA